jgi:farnesyl diphosphate synthase
MQQGQARIEQGLTDWIDAQAPAGLGEAMRYAALDGGKRVRPLLVMATARALGQYEDQPGVLRAACAIELIHAYSLVHDDMPCMDNDVLRRGKPTVHVKFGEAQALLAGDALQSLAFELLTPEDCSGFAPAVQARCCALLARASGYKGMAGGQAIDLQHVGQRMSESDLRQMHRLKTGALLQCSVELGAACAQAPAGVLHELREYGRILGLAFQVVDDILDVTADSATLGKTAGKDAAADKPTYVSLMGLPAARQLADELALQAGECLRRTGLTPDALRALQGLAQRVVQRKN